MRRMASGIVTRLLQLARGMDRGEGPCEDRATAAGPTDGRKRADMVFVGMGDEDPIQPIGAGLEPCDIGQDQVHAGLAVHVGKADADIDEDEALLVIGRAVAVDVSNSSRSPPRRRGGR